jgi:hypothetical protein
MYTISRDGAMIDNKKLLLFSGYEIGQKESASKNAEAK